MSGRMDLIMREATGMEKRKDLDDFTLLLVTFMKDNGKMESRKD